MAVKLGIIRVITSGDQRSTDLHGRQIEAAYGGVEAVSVCLPGQPDGVHDPETAKIH